MDRVPSAPLIFASSWDTYNGILIQKGETTPVEKNKDKYYSIVLDEILSVIKAGGNQRMYYIIGRPQRAKIDGFSCLTGESLLGYKLISNCKEAQEKQNIEINQFLQEKLASYENVRFIDPNNALCDSNKCKVIYKREPIYTDGSHLSIYGAELVTEYIIKNF